MLGVHSIPIPVHECLSVRWHWSYFWQLNPTHPRSSVLLNANDPVAMYLLTETAIGDPRLACCVSTHWVVS
jgi:hypothetical protein